MGVGAGGGVETDLLEDGPKDVTFNGIAEAGVKVPFVGGKVGGEWDIICGNGKFKTGANLGPLQFGRDFDDAWNAGVASKAGAKIEGKVGLKGCAGAPN